MTTLTWPNKHPAEVLDYSLVWLNRLGTDTILTSNWSVPAPLVVEQSIINGSNTTVWLSGGTIANDAITVTNIITTSGGRTMEEGVLLKITDV